MKRWIYDERDNVLGHALVQNVVFANAEYVADGAPPGSRFVFVLAPDELGAYARALELLAQEKEKRP